MLNSAPYRWTLASLTKHVKGCDVQAHTKNGYEPARPFGVFSLASRLCLAWDVFTGTADALYWPNQNPPRAY